MSHPPPRSRPRSGRDRNGVPAPPEWQQPPSVYGTTTMQPPLSRGPVPDVERRRLLRVGAASGALLGAGTGLGGVMLLFWLLILGMSAVFAPLVIAYDQGDPLQEGIAAVITPLTVAVLAVGAVLCLLAIALSWSLLRRWGGGRALGVTAAAAAIAAVAVHVTNLVIVLLSFVLQPDLDEATGIAVVALVAAFVGVGVGAASGAGAWRWMGGALRPRR